MKKLLGIILVAITLNSFSQSFEGTLTYVVDLEVWQAFAKEGVDKEAILNELRADASWGDTINVTYKGGNYYSSPSNGNSGAIYLSSTNKLYSMVFVGKNSDICTVTDASVDEEYSMFEEMPKIEKLDTQVVINGINCDIVRVKWKLGIYDYYYNSSMFAVNPFLFEKHIYDGWSQFLEISKALPIQIVKNLFMMTVTITLISSEEKSVDDSLFTIPMLVKDKKLNKTNIISGREIMRIKKDKRK